MTEWILCRYRKMVNPGKHGSILMPQRTVWSQTDTTPSMSSLNFCWYGWMLLLVMLLMGSMMFNTIFLQAHSFPGLGALTVPCLRPRSMLENPWARSLPNRLSWAFTAHGRRVILARLWFASFLWVQIPQTKLKRLLRNLTLVSFTAL